MPDSAYALQLPLLLRSQMRKVLFVGFVGDRVFEYVPGGLNLGPRLGRLFISKEKESSELSSAGVGLKGVDR